MPSCLLLADLPGSKIVPALIAGEPVAIVMVVATIVLGVVMYLFKHGSRKAA